MTTAEATLVVLPPVANDPETIALLELGRLGLPADRVVVHRYPGHGGRPRQPGFRFADVAEELVREIDGPIDVVGLAIGAYAVAELLLRHPDRIRSALIAASPFADIGPEQRARDRARADAAAPGMTAVVGETLARWFTPGAVERDAQGVRIARERLLAMDPAVWSDVWIAISERSTIGPEQAASVTQPVSIVVPRHDAAGGAPGLERLHAHLPVSRLVYVDGPHMVNLERPRNVLAAIGSHLEWVAAGGARIEAPITLTGE
ncbi:MAG TPA: hypothetical protein VGC45_07775 [Gryllotalpicola sp.]